MAGKIPTTVITGFLGAGKTTLIRHMLENADGKRIALIINEFGDLGVDGGILNACGIEGCDEEDVMELSNGCICCTVAEDFVPTLQTLLDRPEPPDHIVIETSGLALPQPLVRAFNWPEIRTRVTVDGVVAVVDGPAVADGRFAADVHAVDAQRAADDQLDHETPLSELFEDQMTCADMIVLNKTDLMARASAEQLADTLRQQSRAGVQVIRTQMGAVDPAVLLGLGIAAETDMDARREVHHAHDHDDHHDHHDHEDDHHHSHSHEHGHDAFGSFVVNLPALDDPAGFAQRISSVIARHGILRLKGFAAVSGKPMRLVIQAVGPRVDTHFDKPLSASDLNTTRLVVIGEAGMDHAAIRAELAHGLELVA